MAIKLTPPSPGRIVVGPRGGRVRSHSFKHWLDNAAGTPTFSTVMGASGNSYPMMTILLKDGNTWNFLYPATGAAIAWAWGSPSIVGTGSFTPNGAVGADWDQIASGPVFSSTQNSGFFNWDGPMTPLTFTGTLDRALGAGDSVNIFIFNGPGPAYDSFFQGPGTPAGSWMWNTTLPDNTASPNFIQVTPLVQIGSTTSLEQTGSGSASLTDFWSLYKIFNVPGHPGQWFGEWFNAVAWGTQIARVLNSDLAAWLASH